MSRTKKHHYIPQFYLRHWCLDNNRLFRSFKPKAVWIHDRPLPENVAAINNFHRIFGRDGEEICYEEDFVTDKIDTPFALLHRKVATNGVVSLSREERVSFANYLASLQGRNPVIKAKYYDILFDESPPPPEGLPKRFRDGWSEMAVQLKSLHKSRADFGKMIMRAMLNYLDLHGKHLLNCYWVQISLPPDIHPLMTSNYPLSSTAGFGDERSAYFFPVSPASAIVMHNDVTLLTPIKNMTLSERISFLNLFIAGYATEYYSANGAHNAFIERYGGIFLNDDNVRNAKHIIADAVNYSGRLMQDLVERTCWRG